MQLKHYSTTKLSGITGFSLFFLLLIMVLSAWKFPIFSAPVNNFLKLMSLGTATCLVLLSISLLAKMYWSSRLSSWLSGVVFVFAVFRFYELVVGGEYLDRIFWDLTGVSLNDVSGGMSSLTSICLIMVSISIFLTSDQKSKKNGWIHWIPMVLSFFVVFLSTIALAGYLLNLMSAFTWMGIRMSPHTSLSLMMMSLFTYKLNLHYGLEAIYKTSVRGRFGYGAMIVVFFGVIVFAILHLQVNYIANVNAAAIEKIKSFDDFIDIEEIKKLIAVEYEVKELVLTLACGFMLFSVMLFAWIFFSLTNQVKILNKILLDSTAGKSSDSLVIPYLKDNTEFGLIARSIESFLSLNKSEKKLQSRLQKIIASMPNGIVIVNQHGLIDLVNQQTCTIFHYDQNELLGRSVELLVPSLNVGPDSKISAAYFANSDVNSMLNLTEISGVTRHGEAVVLDIGITTIEYESGTQILISIMDITAKKMDQLNLALSREEIEATSLSLERTRKKLEVTTQALGIGVWEYHQSTDKLIWDDTMFALYEVAPESFSGTYAFWTKRVHPDDLQETQEKFLFSVNNNLDFIAKFRILVADNRVKYIQTKAKVDRDSKTQELRIIGTNFDITREELALQKVQQLDILRASIVEYCDDAIVSKTVEGTVTSWNKAAEDMFGYAATEAIGKNVKDLIVTPEDAGEHDELIARVKEGTLVRNHQSRLRCKNGRLIDVAVTFSPIKDGNGNVLSISSIKRDITETLKAARQLEEHQKELMRSNQALETFAYVASHDLKAPLRGIRQLTSWLEEDIAQNNLDAVPDNCQKIKVRIKRMETLLDDLLTYSRVEKMHGLYKKIDLNVTVQDLFGMNNIKPGLILKIVGKLPIFETYATPLEHVINNLLSNAIKHHDKNEGTIQVSSIDKDDHFYEISVIDDGPGIDPQFHQRIFNMFQTLKPRDEVEGSGMGLALVKKIVEQFGGVVDIESRSRGCRFFFTWPKRMKVEGNK
jgi:PAS domain S-box-containing protein